MSARIPEGFTELTFVYHCDGDAEDMLTSIALVYDNDAPSSGLEDIFVGWNAQFKSVTNEHYVIGPHYAIRGSSGPDDTLVTGLDSSPGVDGTTALPPNTSILLRKRGLTRGRRANGRMYLPGGTLDGMSANGVLSDTRVGELQDAWDAFGAVAAGVPGVGGLVVLHQSAPFAPDEVLQVQVQARLATQRRRLRP